MIAAFQKIQDRVPEQCKSCPNLGHLAIEIAARRLSLDGAMSELRAKPYEIDTCPGTDIRTIDASETVFEEIVVATECGRMLDD